MQHYYHSRNDVCQHISGLLSSYSLSLPPLVLQRDFDITVPKSGFRAGFGRSRHLPTGLWRVPSDLDCARSRCSTSQNPFRAKYPSQGSQLVVASLSAAALVSTSVSVTCTPLAPVLVLALVLVSVWASVSVLASALAYQLQWA